MGKVASNILYGFLTVSISTGFAVFVIWIASLVPMSSPRALSVTPKDVPKQIPFDAETWQASGWSRQRVKMAEGAMAALSLGMTAKEVEGILGEHYQSPMQELLGPQNEQAPWFRSPGYGGRKAIFYRGYHLGGHSDEGHNYRRLMCLYFDADDRLVGKELYWRLADRD